jgi:transposase
MIAFNRRTHIYVSKTPSDMRASYDTLFNKVKTLLDKDPFSGHLFVFMNRKRTSCKSLYYDGTGLVIIAKRLEKGTFSKINPYLEGDIRLTQAEFSLFFEGSDLTKRFIESPREIERGYVKKQEEPLQ